MSMAHSLEVRVPLLDHKLIEFVTGLPAGIRANKCKPKRLLTKALEDLMPQKIIHRPKQGFALPLGHWMRGSLRPVVEDTLSFNSVHRRGLFNPESISRLYKDFLRDVQSHTTIWQFVVLELWMRQYIDQPIVLPT
jgi:asparagine synthase (glutamine-hydrolysing)